MASLLAVHAHPDDESSKGAGTLARYVAEGHRVTVVSCTGGESGDVLNAELRATDRASWSLPGLRREEMAKAQAALGIDHLWLGYVDSGMPDEGAPLRALSFATIPLEHSGRPLVRIIRRLQPQVVVTYDENGGYPHPDHIRTHEVTMWAVDHAADPNYAPELGEPWLVSKLYYDRMWHPARFAAVLADYEAHDPASPRLQTMRSWMDRDRGTVKVTTRVDVSAYLEQRDEALRSHESQVPVSNSFFFWPHDVIRRAWPTEDYELVRSQVATTTPETGLFDGIEDQE